MFQPNGADARRRAGCCYSSYYIATKADAAASQYPGVATFELFCQHLASLLTKAIESLVPAQSVDGDSPADLDHAGPSSVRLIAVSTSHRSDWPPRAQIGDMLLSIKPSAPPWPRPSPNSEKPPPDTRHTGPDLRWRLSRDGYSKRSAFMSLIPCCT